MNKKIGIQIFISLLVLAGIAILAIYVRDKFLTNENVKGQDYYEPKEKYEYNEYQIRNISNDALMARYLADYTDKMLYDSLKAYELLDSDTRENVFKNFDTFKSYIQNIEEELLTSRMERYSIQGQNESYKYIVLDQYGNKYIFHVKAVLQYTVTIESEI